MSGQLWPGAKRNDRQSKLPDLCSRATRPSGPGHPGTELFGGVGIYAGAHFFALIADDSLYLKVDDTNRPVFEARGMGPFRPYGQGGEVMQYYRVPEDLLEDPETLAQWAEKAIRVARQAKRGR